MYALISHDYLLCSEVSYLYNVLSTRGKKKKNKLKLQKHTTTYSPCQDFFFIFVGFLTKTHTFKGRKSEIKIGQKLQDFLNIPCLWLMDKEITTKQQQHFLRGLILFFLFGILGTTHAIFQHYHSGCL